MTPLTDKQIIYQLRERLENAVVEARGWKAMAMVLAEGKDLLRRELEQLGRENDE